VLEKISAQVLEMARCCQIGRAEKKSALADFTRVMQGYGLALFFDHTVNIITYINRVTGIIII